MSQRPSAGTSASSRAPHYSNTPLMLPAISQIPGLSQIDCENEKVPSNIRPTDTDYIVLCKQGGRPNLLDWKSMGNSKEAVSYPRCDWFYLEDNAYCDHLEKERDVAENGPYKSKLPDYMIHHDWTDDAKKLSKKRQLYPYYTEAGPAAKPRHKALKPLKLRESATTLPLKKPDSENKGLIKRNDPPMREILSYSFARGK